MAFKDKSLSEILRSLAADEWLATWQYNANRIAAKGKNLNFLDKVFETNGKDEYEDHFNKLVNWMQSKEIPVELDFVEMQKIANTPFVAIKDPTNTRDMVTLEIQAEKEAIDGYTEAMQNPEVTKYPDLVVVLGEILADERTHLKDLEDLKGAMDDESANKIQGMEKIDKKDNKKKITLIPIGATSDIPLKIRLDRIFNLGEVTND